MDAECKKLRISRLLLPGIFLVGLIFIGFPSRQARADCGNGACAVCGDGVLCSDPALCNPVEQCEQDSDCAEGFHCESCACVPNPVCGDGAINSPGEQCEFIDGDRNNDVVPGSQCDRNTCGLPNPIGDAPAPCQCAVCPNGSVATNVNQPEQCDDGNLNNDDACDNTCHNNFCGDERVDNGEECDLSSGSDTCGDSKQCVNAGEPGECTCKLCPQCGNGQLDAGEACDDGNNESGDACENDCTLPVCGNGVVDEGEECDAASANSNNGLCTEDCKLAFCGDGHILNGPDNVITEVCDDGNNINGDGCSDDCLTCPEIACGNGRLDGSDQCEIGHENECGPGTTCNTDTCQCDTNPTPTPVCGNGTMEDGEECDGSDLGECAACDDNCTCEENECPGEGNNSDRERACSAEEEAGHKATICHIPPGNPDNAHTICVDDHAVAAHMEHHGDTLGPCTSGCPESGLTAGDGGGTTDGPSSTKAGGCSLITGESDVHMIVPLMSLMSVALSLFWVRRQVK